jgi:hypothetical protein
MRKRPSVSIIGLSFSSGDVFDNPFFFSNTPAIKCGKNPRAFVHVPPCCRIPIIEPEYEITIVDRATFPRRRTAIG